MSRRLISCVLLVVPVTMVITEELGVSPYPYLVSQIFASNIGGTATLIGDPPNILIGSLVGLTFNQFLVNLAPVVVVALAVTCGMFHLLWGRKLKATPEARARGEGQLKSLKPVRGASGQWCDCSAGCAAS